MYHSLLQFFSVICGENPDHIWSPGGQPLPCCQRCTGLYAAALLAVARHIWLRPCITRRFLQFHALFLLQLGLFAFPWLPDSSALRSVSGSLFAFGVVAFLWPAVSGWLPTSNHGRAGRGAYALGMVASAGLIPAIATWGGAIGGSVLMCLVLAGALALAGLAIANLVRLPSSLASSLRLLPHRRELSVQRTAVAGSLSPRWRGEG